MSRAGDLWARFKHSLGVRDRALERKAEQSREASKDATTRLRMHYKAATGDLDSVFEVSEVEVLVPDDE